MENTCRALVPYTPTNTDDAATTPTPEVNAFSAPLLYRFMIRAMTPPQLHRPTFRVGKSHYADIIDYEHVPLQIKGIGLCETTDTACITEAINEDTPDRWEPGLEEAGSWQPGKYETKYEAANALAEEVKCLRLNVVMLRVANGVFFDDRVLRACFAVWGHPGVPELYAWLGQRLPVPLLRYEKAEMLAEAIIFNCTEAIDYLKHERADLSDSLSYISHALLERDDPAAYERLIQAGAPPPGIGELYHFLISDTPVPNLLQWVLDKNFPLPTLFLTEALNAHDRDYWNISTPLTVNIMVQMVKQYLSGIADEEDTVNDKTPMEIIKEYCDAHPRSPLVLAFETAISKINV